MSQGNLSQLTPMQLEMVIPLSKVVGLPDLWPPPGYTLRGYRPGDEDRLVDLLISVGFEEWTREKLDAYLDGPERRRGTRIVTHGKDIVALTFASQRVLKPKIGALDYVSSHSEHRGKKLGEAVCTSVLKYLVHHAYPWVTLSTDDFRLAAIKVYLNLGFTPKMHREDMPERWEAVRKQLGFSEPLEVLNSPSP